MSTSPSAHVSVLLEQIVQWLQPQAGQTLVDGTLGGGGHTRALAELVGPTGRIIALDRDPAAVAAAQETLAGLSVQVEQANFCDLPEVLAQLDIPAVDGIVLDLGLSSDQLADPERGFSFFGRRPLGFAVRSPLGRAGPTPDQPSSAEHLADLIYYFGEERYSRRVARAIVKRRHEQPIETSIELAELVRSCVPRSKHDRIDPATRTFQALRIAVNNELKSLEIALRRFPECLRPGGRLAVISFHSLEDRPVKEAFRDDPRWEALMCKPLRPDEAEVERNPQPECEAPRRRAVRGADVILDFRLLPICWL